MKSEQHELIMGTVVGKFDTHSQLRLLQFLSPALPVGSYSYSQGLEWAVENGWVIDKTSFREWVEGQIVSTLKAQELPLLIRLYHSVLQKNVQTFDHWTQVSIALRDTAELRQEERDRANAYVRVLESLVVLDQIWDREYLLRSPLAPIALYAVLHNIALQPLLVSYAHNWLETQIVAGVKIIPLGQSTGQQLQYQLHALLQSSIALSKEIADENVGMTLPAMSFASCAHETQYSRVYRS